MKTNQQNKQKPPDLAACSMNIDRPITFYWYLQNYLSWPCGLRFLLWFWFCHFNAKLSNIQLS